MLDSDVVGYRHIAEVNRVLLRGDLFLTFVRLPKKMMQVPHEWQALARSGILPPYWVTYYGDIYSGWHMYHLPDRDRFFILSNNQFHDYQNLRDKSAENMRKIAWEIRDVRIIKEFIPPGNTIGDTIMPPMYSRGDMKRFRKMFVFGAGASAFCSFNETQDAINKSPLRPPTGYEIFDSRFDSLINKYEGALTSVPLFEERGKDIEGCLEQDWELIRNVYNPHITARHINVQFYLQDLFKQISAEVVNKFFRYNLYAVMCNKVLNALSGSNEKASFVSFNYDTILDTFLERATQNKFTEMRSYMDAGGAISLFKPHGSCNWGWPFLTSALGNMGGKSLSTYIFDMQFTPNHIYYKLLGGYNKMVLERSWGEEQTMNPNNIGRYTPNKNAIEVMDATKQYLPALLLPYRDKDEFVMPMYHSHMLHNAMNEVEDLFLIGWKGNEYAFNRLLKLRSNSLRRIVIVNPDGEGVIKNLSEHFELSSGQNRYRVETIKTFKEFVVDRLDSYLTTEQ